MTRPAHGTLRVVRTLRVVMLRRRAAFECLSGMVGQFRVCSLCQSLYARCRFCCLWTGLPARAAQAAIDQCQWSRVHFGEIARACLQGRLPWQLLPWPLMLDFGRFCAGETDEDEVESAYPLWADSIVRRVLYEDV